MVLTFQYLKNVIIISFLGKLTFVFLSPPSYVHEVWNYREANVKSIQKAIQKTFGNLSVDGKVDVLNERLMKIFWNYISNQKVKCYCCQPPSMNGKIKKCLRKRSKLIKFYYKNGQKKNRSKKNYKKKLHIAQRRY